MSSKIDVTELLTDPDFVGPVIHIGRIPRINSLGEQVLIECQTKTVGSVQPIDGKKIERIPEALRVANMMTFFMKGKIITSGPGKYSDILVFEGLRYQVKTVDDWSSWGTGFCEGMCIAEVPA